jgi:hypothetical protein
MAFLHLRPMFNRKSHLSKKQLQQQQRMKKHGVVQDDESLDATDVDVSTMSFKTETESADFYAVPIGCADSSLTSEISPTMEESVDTDTNTAKLSPVNESPELKRRKELLLDNMDRFYTDYQAYRKGDLTLDDSTSEDESDDCFESDDEEELYGL